MKNTRGYIALFITILIWGTTFLITKVVLREIGPLQLTFIRFLLAFSAMAPFAARQGFRLKDILRPKFILFGLTGTTLYYTLQNVGLTFTSVSSTVLILAIIPALTTVLAFFFLKESLGRAQIAGIVLVTIGMLLVGMSSVESAQAVRPMLGNLLIFASALSWAVYTIQGRKMVGEYPALVMSAASTAAGAILLLPFVGWETSALGLPNISTGSWLSILYLGIVASGLTTYLWNEALHYLSASVASSYLNLIPVIGLAGSYFLGEKPPLVQLLGGGIAILGVWLSSRFGKSRQQKA